MPGNICPDAGGNTVCDGAGACKEEHRAKRAAARRVLQRALRRRLLLRRDLHGQCQACNVAGSLGTCAAVTGAPVPPRGACNAGNAMCVGHVRRREHRDLHVSRRRHRVPVDAARRQRVHRRPTVASAACNGNGACANQRPGGSTAPTTRQVQRQRRRLPGQLRQRRRLPQRTDYCSSAGGGTCAPRHDSGTACVTRPTASRRRVTTAADGNACAASGQCCPTACAPASSCDWKRSSTARRRRPATSAAPAADDDGVQRRSCYATARTRLPRRPARRRRSAMTGYYCDATGHCAIEKEQRDRVRSDARIAT